MLDYTERKNTELIVIHCSATKADHDIGAEEIRSWHVNDNGWLDIGYHLVIRRNGRVETGRPLTCQGSHVLGHNAKSVGICMVGGIGPTKQPENNFTEEQWYTLELTLRWLRRIWPAIDIVGHNSLDSGKDCPCFDVSDWIQEINL